MARAAAKRRTSAFCSSSTRSFFLNDLGHGQITELFADSDKLIHNGFKLTHGLNLLAVERHQLRIGETEGHGLGSLFTSQ